MKNRIDKVRIWIIKKLFSDNEKYLLRLAIEDRIDNLDKLKIIDRNTNYEYANNDISDLRKMKKIFSSEFFL